MEWDAKAIRAAGMMIEILTVSWRLASLAALAVGALSPRELLEIFQLARESNTPVFGPHAVYIECVNRHLAVLKRGGMIAPGALVNGRRRYFLTPFATAFLAAMEPAGDYAVLHYDWLVEVGRQSRKISVALPARNFTPPIPDLTEQARLRSRGLALVFSRLLAQRWTFTVLAMLAAGPARFSALLARADSLIADNPDIMPPTARLGRSTLTNRLESLCAYGLVERVDDSANRNPARPPNSREYAYVLTGAGQSLLRALEELARFGTEHDDELVNVVRALTP